MIAQNTSYVPPLASIQFSALVAAAGTQVQFDPEMHRAVLDSAADLGLKYLLPIDASGDRKGCVYNPETQSVRTPKGTQEAYQAVANAGFIGMDIPVNDGGSELPYYMTTGASEIMFSSNMSFCLLPILTGAGAGVIATVGSQKLKQLCLPDMLSGKTAATMCLTEPQAGSDLALITTMGTPTAEEGVYEITGNKIFITGGEHDVTDNIYHLVLARTPNAAKGTNGLSLFMVPKILQNEDGSLAEGNDITCTGIEHKMGLHASPTCSMSFEKAKGWIIGKEGDGMKNMFIMMNEARLKVGLQGLGIAERAKQQAMKYTETRKQGSVKGQTVSINQHSNIQLSLLDMESQIQGYRLLGMRVAMAVGDPDQEQYVSMMTPVLKANMTEMGEEVASRALKIHGGAGYIVDTGAEQLVRDSIIPQIYEGTNDIQARTLC